MGVLDSVGVLAGAVVAAMSMLVFAIVSVFLTVFIVDVAASIAGLIPTEDGFVVPGATIIAAAATVGGGSGIVLVEVPETKSGRSRC